MIEVMMALVVLALLTTAAATLTVKSFAVTASDRQRVRAANLAAQEVDRVRGLMQTDPAAISTPSTATNPLYQVVNLTSTLFTVASTQTVGGTVFSLLDNGTWQTNKAGVNNALDLSVVVTWPNMQGVAPVTNTSVLNTEGTGGNGSSGTVGGVSAAGPTTPEPVQTLSPTCSLQDGTVDVVADSTVTTPGGTYVGLWDGDSTILGTVYAQPTGSNPCTSTIQLGYVGSNGAYTAALPYGTWTLTAKLNDGAVVTEPGVVTVNSAGPLVAATLVDPDNCGGAPSVQYNVSSSLLGQIVGAVVTGSRSTSGTNGSTCSVPVPSTTFTTIAGGLFTGNTAYGNWTFTASDSLFSGPLSASATVGSGTTTIKLTDSGCPAISAPITLTANQGATIYGTTTYANLTSGTITATRAANGGCALATQTIPIGSTGTASVNLPYGLWTFSNGTSPFTSWPSLNITTTSGQSTTVTTAASCSATPTTVTITVKDSSLLSTLTGTLRATMVGNGTVCQPAGASTTTPLVLSIVNGLLGLGDPMTLAPGTYTFSVDGTTLVSTSPASLTVPGSPTALTLTVK
jgi:Tfp pilus assembly protein PilV